MLQNKVGMRKTLVQRQGCMKYHLPKYCSNMRKTHKIPQECSLIHVNVAHSHLPRRFLATLWCLQFPHLFSTLLPEPCACLFLLHFYDVSALAISFALLVLSNNRMSGWLTEVLLARFLWLQPRTLSVIAFWVVLRPVLKYVLLPVLNHIWGLIVMV